MPKENAVVQAEKPVVKIVKAKDVKKETKVTPVKENVKSKKKAEPTQTGKNSIKAKVQEPILQEETPTILTTFEFLPTEETTEAVLAMATTTKNEQFTGEIISVDEVVKLISVNNLHPPEFHPFQVNDDEAMTRLCESVKEYGVREPGLARQRFDKNGNPNGFELLCGNRRKRACELSGQKYMPVIIRELDDDNAVIAMVDSNLEQREQLLFSEKAWAYRIKMEALNHKGLKSGNGKTSAETLTEQTGESKNQIFRLIRLTELVVGLIDKVDMKQLAFNPAVELSYLSQSEQFFVISAMEEHDIKPSLSQAVRLRKLKQERKLTETLINSILAESKPKSSQTDKEFKRYKKYFPDNYTPKQINKVITELLKTWQSENLLQNVEHELFTGEQANNISDNAMIGGVVNA